MAAGKPVIEELCFGLKGSAGKKRLLWLRALSSLSRKSTKTTPYPPNAAVRSTRSPGLLAGLQDTLEVKLMCMIKAEGLALPPL